MNVSRICELAVQGGLLTEADAEDRAATWQQQGSDDDGAGFVDWLAEQRIVTDFQAEALKAGVAGPYEFGPYRVVDRLAGGRLGTVYRAVHAEFDQPVSLKIFPASLKHDSESAMRLARETRIAVQVDHLNVVRTFQVGKVGEIVFVAFEDLEGETLASALEWETKLSADESCRLIRDAARGLAHLHEREIVLRDIQPANIWVAPEGTAKLMEFGAARDALAALDSLDDEGSIDATYFGVELLASYDYLPPEQGADETQADARSDIYALGCVFFEALTGEVVFPDENPVRKALRHAREEPRKVTDIDPTIPTAVADIVATMLAKEPGDRYQTAQDVAWALDGVISVEEEQELAARQIDEVFLKWAGATSDLSPQERVVAEPKLIDFLEWAAYQEKPDRQ